MPNVKSAEKRMRTNVVRAQRNKQQRSRLRTAIRKVRQAENAEAAGQALQQAISLLDRAARKRIVHPNLAARTKSRLTTFVRGIGA